MGRTKNSGLSIGIGSSPQGSLSQSNVDSKVKELAKQEMIEKLTKAGVKFTKEDVIFVTKDKTGQLIWLEKGNDGVGLKHILYGDKEKKNSGHALHFKEAFGLETYQISGFINKVISNGNVVSSILKKIGNRMGYERIYSYKDKKIVLVSIGTNGFIVTAYPYSKGEKK